MRNRVPQTSTARSRAPRLRRRNWRFIAALGVLVPALLTAAVLLKRGTAQAQGSGPTLLDTNLKVQPVVTGLTTPTTMAFLGANDILVLEKNTGKVKRIVNGAVQSTVLDLAVNSSSERGLLGIALDPEF